MGGRRRREREVGEERVRKRESSFRSTTGIQVMLNNP